MTDRGAFVSGARPPRMDPRVHEHAEKLVDWCARVDAGDHVVIEAEHKRPADRNSVDDYMVHTDCYRELAADWVVPA